MKKIIFTLAVIAIAFSLAACGNGIDSSDLENAPEIILVGDLVGQEGIYFGMTKEALVDFLGYPAREDEGEKKTIWYDFTDSYYGFEGSMGFSFSENDRLDRVTQSFVPDLIGQSLGEESDIQGLYSSLDSQIVEKLGEPSSESGSDIDWEAETWTVSLYQQSELFVSVVQSWYPQKAR